jgi:hypothetical protein
VLLKRGICSVIILGYGKKRPKMINQRGKRTEAWEKARAVLKGRFEAAGIITCELRFQGCWYDNGLGFAHTKKRRHLEGGDLYRVVLACNHCHDLVELLPEREMTAILERRIMRREKPIAPHCHCGHIQAMHVARFEGETSPALQFFTRKIAPHPCQACNCENYTPRR